MTLLKSDRASRLGLEERIWKTAIRHDEGSSIVEFVLFGLPLLMATLIFFASLYSTTIGQTQGRELAREAVQAFVNSKNDVEGYLVVTQLLQKFENSQPAQIDSSSEDFPRGRITAYENSLHFTVQCQRYPCISPSNSVVLRLFRISGENRRIPLASASSTVSTWIP